MRSACSVVLTSVALLASGCAMHRTPQPAAMAPAASPAPVAAVGAVRESLPNDYLRVSFLPAGVPVTCLSRPGALRAFATATPLYQPPLKLANLPLYSGLVNNDQNVLVAMRCQPPDPAVVDALLATWPNVFLALEHDIALKPGSCMSESDDPATALACYARGFSDPPSSTVPTALAKTMDYAGKLFDSNHTALAAWLKSNYGIFPAFSGLGYSVKDSYYLDKQPMTAQQLLVESISPEYILKNVSLAAAGCHCIAVPPYAGRAQDRLDPAFIDRAGGNGSCTTVNRLEVVGH